MQHILIVVHDLFLRDICKALLRSASCEVTSVDSDDLAIASVDRDRLDLLLMRERYSTLCVLKIVPVGEADRDPKTFQIPCKRLPTFFSMLSDRGQQQAIPDEIHGPVFISSQEITGAFWGPGDMSPYYQFKHARPAQVLAGEILRFDEGYKVPAIASLSHNLVAYTLVRKGDLDQAMEHAKRAVELAPESRYAHEVLAAVYAARHQNGEAMREYQTAVHLYETAHPEFTKVNRPPVNPLAQER